MKKILIKSLYIYTVTLIIILSYNTISLSADPKLISTLNNAFEKLEGYLVKLSTPAAAVAIGTGVFMKKFSFRWWGKNTNGKKNN